MDVAKAFIIGILALVLIGVVSMIVLNQLESTALISSTVTAGSVTNETGAYINSTGYTLDSASLTGFGSPSITLALNATDNSTIGAGNYTLSSAGVLTNATATTYDDVLISYTYTITSDSDTQAVIGNTTSGLNSFFSNIGVWLSLLGVVIIILIIAAVVAVVNRFGNSAQTTL